MITLKDMKIDELEKELAAKRKTNDQLIELMKKATSEMSNKDHAFGFEIATSFVRIALTKDIKQ